MALEDLGYNNELEDSRKAQGLDPFTIGRVVLEHRDRYTVKTESGEFDCELIGNLRFTVTEKRELPFVGDWVAIAEYDEGKALIHAVLRRRSILERKAIGKFGQTQVIAANIDVGRGIEGVYQGSTNFSIDKFVTPTEGADGLPSAGLQ